MRWWCGGIVGLLVALGLTAGTAQAFQVALLTSRAHEIRFSAEFVAAPWDRTDLTVRASDGGQTITFHDANGIAGKNPPSGRPGPWFVDPCQIVDQHTARCHASGRLEVFVELSDAPSRYRDLAPAAGTLDPFETVLSGLGDDDIAIAHGSSPNIDDAGGVNTLKIASTHGWISAENGIHNVLDVRNGTAGDTVHCGLGEPGSGTLATTLGLQPDAPLVDHGIGDTVLADPGDTIAGCENDLPG